MIFEIYYKDLNKEAQQRFLECAGIDKPADGNYDMFPISVMEFGYYDIEE